MDNSNPSGSERERAPDDTRTRRTSGRRGQAKAPKDAAAGSSSSAAATARHPPRLSINPYINFVMAMRKSKEMQGLSETERVRKAGEMWSAMSDEERRPYYVMAERARRQRRRDRDREPQDVAQGCARHHRRAGGGSSRRRSRSRGKRRRSGSRRRRRRR